MGFDFYNNNKIATIHLKYHKLKKKFEENYNFKTPSLAVPLNTLYSMT